MSLIFRIQLKLLCHIQFVRYATCAYKLEAYGFDSPMVSLEFFIDIILPATLWAMSSTQRLTEMSTSDISWEGVGGREGGRCVCSFVVHAICRMVTLACFVGSCFVFEVIREQVMTAPGCLVDDLNFQGRTLREVFL
jgi:hypothetical protein